MKSTAYLIISVICSALALSACQTTPTASSKDAPQYENIITLKVKVDSDGDGVLDEIDECPETLPNRVVDAKGCPIVVDVGGLELAFHGFFPPMSSQLLAIYDAEFSKIAEKINEYPEAGVFIFGHVATNELNRDALATFGVDSLARNRALVIKNTLVLKHNIDAERIRTYDCLNKLLVKDTDYINPSFVALNLKGLVSKQRRATLMASSAVNDLTNLKYDSYIKRYGEYAKYCEPFE